METQLTEETIFSLLGVRGVPKTPTEGLEIIQRSCFCLYPSRASGLAKILSMHFDGFAIDTVVYDRCDPVLGIMVAEEMNLRRSASGGKEVWSVPNAFGRSYRISSFEPGHDEFIADRRILVVDRYVTDNPRIINCVRACRELGASAVYVAALANKGRSEKDTGADAIRTLLLY
jgi:hypothetical protein